MNPWYIMSFSCELWRMAGLLSKMSGCRDKATKCRGALCFSEPRFLHWCSTQQLPDGATGCLKGISNSKCWNSRNLRSNEMIQYCIILLMINVLIGTCISYLLTSPAARLNRSTFDNGTKWDKQSPHLLTQLVASFLRMLNLLHNTAEKRCSSLSRRDKSQPSYILYYCINTLWISIVLLALLRTVDPVENHIHT